MNKLSPNHTFHSKIPECSTLGSFVFSPAYLPQSVPQSDVDGRLFSLPLVCLLAECFLLMVIPPSPHSSRHVPAGMCGFRPDLPAGASPRCIQCVPFGVDYARLITDCNLLTALYSLHKTSGSQNEIWLTFRMLCGIM